MNHALELDRLTPTQRSAGRNAGTQRWLELLFVHWTYPIDVVRPLVPPEVIPTLEKAFAANSRISQRIETFPDTRHGFCFPERADYNHAAAEAVWSRVFDLLRRRVAV